MQDTECVEFLQWALPRLHRCWPGFRKVRGQVCKRIDRRWKGLSLSGPRAYRDYLEEQPAEWEILDRLCPVTITSFYRDKTVFDFIGATLLPRLARESAEHGTHELRALSIGCASGEEPFNLPRRAESFPPRRESSSWFRAKKRASRKADVTSRDCRPP
jgi:chemotaxis protein methyltransferase CheR